MAVQQNDKMTMVNYGSQEYYQNNLFKKLKIIPFSIFDPMISLSFLTTNNKHGKADESSFGLGHKEMAEK